MSKNKNNIDNQDYLNILRKIYEENEISQRGLAKKLGFSEISHNSMDAVSDRDFVIELASSLSIIGIHLSRICEELVLWMNPQFSLVELDEGFCTGSSIMPQKKNPDVPELIRGKTGGVYGSLVGVLTLMKGLPLTYNRDMQEDKSILFESIDTTMSCLSLMPRMISTMSLNKDNATSIASSSFSTATDLAEYLSKKGMPFRTSHHIVGDIVKFCEKKSIQLKDLSLEDLRNFSDLIGSDIHKVLDPVTSVKSRNGVGETAPQSVKRESTAILKRLKKFGFK